MSTAHLLLVTVGMPFRIGACFFASKNFFMPLVGLG